MHVILTVAAIIALACGLLASYVIQSDVRWEIVATCWIGGFLLMGTAHILDRINRIDRRLSELSSVDHNEH